jgi:hypothetical protein
MNLKDALAAVTDAKKECLLGKYPAALVCVAEKLELCKRALKTISHPRRGLPEETWNEEEIAQFANSVLKEVADEEDK